MKNWFDFADDHVSEFGLSNAGINLEKLLRSLWNITSQLSTELCNLILSRRDAKSNLIVRKQLLIIHKRNKNSRHHTQCSACLTKRERIVLWQNATNA